MKQPISLERDSEGQFVEIPPEFELPGQAAIMRKEGGKIIIEPAPKKRSLLELLDQWEPIDEEFPEIEDLPPGPVDL